MFNPEALVKLCCATALGLLLLNGCAYMQDRGNDALDIVDVGLSVNTDPKPGFALYLDFFNVLPLGYSHVDAISLGIGNRQIGALDFTHESWGVILVGEELKGSGEFNPYDPHQARSDQHDLATRPEFDVGLTGAFKGEQPPPDMQFLECDRILHLGWIGVHATMRPVDLVDFVLGWTTLDILGDDDIPQP